MQIEPIEKIVDENNQIQEKKDEGSSLLVQDIMKRSSSIHQPVAGVRNVKNLVFRDVKTPSDRLYEFNNFCLVNKSILNKIVKNIYKEKNIYFGDALLSNFFLGICVLLSKFNFRSMKVSGPDGDNMH